MSSASIENQAAQLRSQGELHHFYSDPVLRTQVSEHLDTSDGSRLLTDAMSIVGGGYCAAVGAGTMLGAYNGLRYGESGSFKIRLNAVLNATGKRAIKMANSTAVLLLMYQSMDLLIGLQQQIPEEEDEEGNIIINPLNEEIKFRPAHAMIAGAATGALFMSPGGMGKSLRGAIYGLILSTAHCLWNGRIYVNDYFDEMKEKERRKQFEQAQTTQSFTESD